MFVQFRSVEFRTVEEAKRAVEKMHQFEYGGRKLAVKLVRAQAIFFDPNHTRYFNFCIIRTKKVFVLDAPNINRWKVVFHKRTICFNNTIIFRINSAMVVEILVTCLVHPKSQVRLFSSFVKFNNSKIKSWHM